MPQVYCFKKEDYVDSAACFAHYKQALMNGLKLADDWVSCQKENLGRDLFPMTPEQKEELARAEEGKLTPGDEKEVEAAFDPAWLNPKIAKSDAPESDGFEVLKKKMLKKDEKWIRDFIPEQIEDLDIPDDIASKEELVDYFIDTLDIEQADQILEEEFGMDRSKFLAASKDRSINRENVSDNITSKVGHLL